MITNQTNNQQLLIVYIDSINDAPGLTIIYFLFQFFPAE
jgi:hypothetical protein